MIAVPQTIVPRANNPSLRPTVRLDIEGDAMRERTKYDM